MTHKAEAFGDDTTESTNAAGRSGAAAVESVRNNRRRQGDDGLQVHSGPHVGLGISISLSDLTPFPLGRLGTSVVLSQSLKGDQSVVTLSQELGSRRRVGQEVPNKRGEGQGERSDEQEDPLVGMN